MADRRNNREMQNRQPRRDQENRVETRDQENNGESYYSYSYGYGYYDPNVGWVWEDYGPYYGVGPSGYKRSDDRICEDINDMLWQNGQIDASNIGVDVHDGVATLKGTVDNRYMKRMAEDLAYSTPGVNDVQNQLRIQAQAQGNRRLSRGRQGSMDYRSQLKPGMDVIGSDGNKIGTVKEVHDNDMLIDRSLAMDVHAPFSAIDNVSSNQVKLNVPADQIDKMHWGTTPNKATVRL